MPIDFGMLIGRNRELPACSLGTSIAQNIFLIVSSKFNEHRFDDKFGCELWDRDFEFAINTHIWQEQIDKSILNTLIMYEPRLGNIEVSTNIAEVEYVNPSTKVISIKKRVIVNVKGNIKATGEAFSFSPKLFVSPVSID